MTSDGRMLAHDRGEPYRCATCVDCRGLFSAPTEDLSVVRCYGCVPQASGAMGLAMINGHVDDAVRMGVL